MIQNILTLEDAEELTVSEQKSIQGTYLHVCTG